MYLVLFILVLILAAVLYLLYGWNHEVDGSHERIFGGYDSDWIEYYEATKTAVCDKKEFYVINPSVREAINRGDTSGILAEYISLNEIMVSRAGMVSGKFQKLPALWSTYKNNLSAHAVSLVDNQGKANKTNIQFLNDLIMSKLDPLNKKYDVPATKDIINQHVIAIRQCVNRMLREAEAEERRLEAEKQEERKKAEKAAQEEERRKQEAEEHKRLEEEHQKAEAEERQKAEQKAEAETEEKQTTEADQQDEERHRLEAERQEEERHELVDESQVDDETKSQVNDGEFEDDWSRDILNTKSDSTIYRSASLQTAAANRATDSPEKSDDRHGYLSAEKEGDFTGDTQKAHDMHKYE
jgi:hypothetical protein